MTGAMFSKATLSSWDSWDSLVYVSEAALTNHAAEPDNVFPENVLSLTVSELLLLILI